MSGTLYWEVPKPGKPVGDLQIRNAIQKRYGDQATLGHSDKGFLEGLAYGNVKGAQELLDAIEKYDEINVYVGY